MRIEHLQYLTAIAKYHSISIAAKKLYISQTGLSAIVNSIEAELNIQIFKRTKRGTQITPEGEQALALIEEILSKSEELHFLHSDVSQYHQIVNLGVFPAAASALSQYLVRIWSKKNRNAHLHIYEVGFEASLSFIHDQNAKIVVSADTPHHLEERYTNGNGKVYLERLCSDRFCVLCSAESDLAGRSVLHIGDILDRHLILTHQYPDPQDKPIGYILHKFDSFTVLNNLEVAKRVLMSDPNSIILAPALMMQQDELFAPPQRKIMCC